MEKAIDLRRVLAVAVDEEPDERGQVMAMAILAGEGVIALPGSAN